MANTSRASQTKRERESQKIMRDKATRKRVADIARHMQMMLVIAPVVLVLVALVIGFLSGAVQRWGERATDAFYGATARAGFSVQTLYLEGRDRTPMHEIDAALGVKKGAPILAVSVDEVRARLEGLRSVRMAAVERALPHTLYVRIAEREPIARWQYQGQVALVDDQGVVMTGIEAAPFHNLPLVVGKGAPEALAELFQLLADEPMIASRLVAAVRVGERRWNLRLTQGIEVKLPELHADKALKVLSRLQKEQTLLDRGVAVIDLRLADRMFITRNAGDSGKKTTKEQHI